MFIFTVKNLTLKKGERMVLPVAEFPLEYTDLYTLEIPFAPPPEVRRSFNSQRQAELAKLFHAPKVMHKIRLRNKSPYPLTTAPAIIQQDGRLLGQGMMTYTPAGGSVDLTITTAVDVSVKKSDTETGRTPNAATRGGYKYDRINLEGSISLTNYRNKAVELEIVRYVLGNASDAGKGRIEKVNVHEGAWQIGRGYPNWWRWYSWPSWWHHLNGMSRVQWKIKLEAGKSVELPYKWHYFWRG